jgi:hypothetical protein
VSPVDLITPTSGTRDLTAMWRSHSAYIAFFSWGASIREENAIGFGKFAFARVDRGSRGDRHPAAVSRLLELWRCVRIVEDRPPSPA